jgi:RNA polymerase sigma-70 factor (ECF subfamily)
MDTIIMKNTNVQSDSTLIQACIEGDRRAQKAFYERFARSMYVVAMRYSKTTHEADDILQDAFVKIFGNLSSFKGDCPIEYWVKRVVVNTALKYNRRKLDKAPTEDVKDFHQTTEEEPDMANIGFEQLLAYIRTLAPRYQMIFNMYAIEGYKHKEIAEMLGITEGTSKSQYARAKALLQEMILKDEGRYEQIRG